MDENGNLFGPCPNPTRQRGAEHREACRQDVPRLASERPTQRLTLPQNAKSVRPR